MKFASYLPYDWREPYCSNDYVSMKIGEQIIYCIPADTVEDFIINSLITQPVCAEELVVFEVKQFYWVEKCTQYQVVNQTEEKRATPRPILSSREAVKYFAEKTKSDTPYQLFIDNYLSTFKKWECEFIVPKNRIKPICTVDVKNITESFLDNAPDCYDMWRQERRDIVDSNLDYFMNIIGNKKERAIRHIEGAYNFDCFIMNQPILDVAYELYGTEIDLDVNPEIYCKLYQRFDETPTFQRLKKLVDYIKKSIKYI